MSTPADALPVFGHRQAAHCESGAVASLLAHAGVELSEPFVFGLASALSFAYVSFLRIGGFPLVAYRMPPGWIIRRTARALHGRFRSERFRSTQQAQVRLDELLAAGIPVGLQTSVYWLDYIPPAFRFHFNAHNIIAFGKEASGYRISDPVFEAPQMCSTSSLSRARFARGLLAPRGRLYYLEQAINPPAAEQLNQAAWRALRATAQRMLLPFLPLTGAGAIRRLARDVAELARHADPAYAQRFVGHLIRMQEEIGTGGGGFRFMQGAFMQELAQRSNHLALAEEAARCMQLGDQWREFALAGGRMIKGRSAWDFPALGARLAELAAGEHVLHKNVLALCKQHAAAH